MRCPMCRAENPEGARFCNSCGGMFTEAGVDYARSSMSSESYRDHHEVEAEEFARDYGDSLLMARFAAAPIAMLIMTTMGLLLLYRGYSDGDTKAAFIGVFMLAMSVLIAVSWLRFFRRFPGFLDADRESPSADDSSDIAQEINLARLRR